MHHNPWRLLVYNLFMDCLYLQVKLQNFVSMFIVHAVNYIDLEDEKFNSIKSGIFSHFCYKIIVHALSYINTQ